MKTDTLRTHLEELVEGLGYTIRKERGGFRGDHCVLEGDKVVMINKKKPVDLQVGLYARILRGNVENTYIKPAVRKELVELWKRFDKHEETKQENNGPE